MKKSLLFAAALVATSSAFADYYVIGSNVNGSEWSLAQNDAKMTQTQAGVYEWEGDVLGSAFKINDGTWDNAAANFGGDGTICVLGQAYSYITGDGSQDIKFENDGNVENPKVVLNTNNQTITVTGTLVEKPAIDPSEVTFYMIGSNVNGHEWALAQEDCKFESLGNGMFRWEGEVLGTGFKINDGTWSNPQFNIGAANPPADIYMNTPYKYFADGSSGNIAFFGFTELKNPVVELNYNDGTITLVGGDPAGEANWYIMGIDENYNFDESTILAPSNGSTYEREIEIAGGAGGFKISDDGWAHQFGTNYPEEVFIDPDNMMVDLEVVGGEGGKIPYELEEGVYVVIFDLDELTVKFVAFDAAVDTIGVENGEAVYYNLQGVKVANPDKGIYVKVVNGKATKVVL